MKQIDYPDNYGAIEEKEFYSYDKSKFVIVSAPYEGTVTWGKGTAKGPSAIIKASQNMELYDEELDKENYKAGICTLKELEAADSPEKMVDEIEKTGSSLIKDGKIPVMLGGEHSISTGLVRAFKKKYDDLSVLQLDAHADLRQEYEGSKYSHASVMARVREICPAVQVGIRSLSVEESEWIKKDNLPIFFAKDIHDSTDWMDDAISKLSDNVYITIDLDVFDPSILSATGTPEPGGLRWYQVVKFLRKVCEQKNIVGFDVVELAPSGDISCDFLAAKLVYKLVGYLS
ncbi:agmatinase [Candidatus Woesearchaeota archaeon]|nr:agmatinase [Candidatus Woesearchaeota archaeon]